jgi:hypothetical protein
MLAVQPNERRANILPPGGILRSGALALLQDAPADGVVADRSGAGNNMVLASGRCIVTDGITDYAWFPNSTNFNFARKTVMISVCLFVTAWPAANATIFERQGGSNGGYWFLSEHSSSTMTFISRQPASASVHSLVRFPRPALNAWAKIDLTVTNGVLTAATVNGVAQTLTVATAPTGTYGDRADRLSVAAWTSGSVTPASFLAARIAALTFTEGTTLLFRALLNSHASGDLNTLTALDSSGNGLHGTFVGCDGLTGIGIPAEVRGLGAYADYMWFDGASSGAVVQIPALTIPGEFVIEFSGRLITPVQQQYVFGSVSGDSLISITTTTFRVRNSSGTQSSAIIPNLNGTDVQIRIVRNSSNVITLSNFGVTLASLTLSGTLVFNLIGGAGTSRFRGYMRGVRVDVGATGTWTFVAEGNGVTSAAWGGGTVSGSPLTIGQLRYMPVPQTAAMDWNKDGAMLVPQTPNGLDAQGNAISLPRPHPAFLNFPEQGESGVITTVPGVRTFSFWCYWDGVTAKKLIDLGTPEINVTSGGVVSTTGITSPTLYVDGVASTALTVGYHQIAVTSATAFDCTPVTADDPSGDHLFYTVAQSAGQILRNFKATRKRYS